LHKQTGRLFLCARCQTQVLVCGPCDRGQRYCATGCADITRLNLQTRGWQALSAGSRRVPQTRISYAPVAPTPGCRSKDSDASQFPCHPRRCCTARQRIATGNPARFTTPITMQPYRLGVQRALRYRQYPQRRACTGLALPLFPVTVSGAGAPGLSAPQPVAA
jgi:hypothetical protein